MGPAWTQRSSSVQKKNQGWNRNHFLFRGLKPPNTLFLCISDMRDYFHWIRLEILSNLVVLHLKNNNSGAKIIILDPKSSAFIMTHHFPS